MYSVVQGALDPDMPVAVTENGVAEDITDASVIKLHWERPDGTIADVDLIANSDLGGLAAGQLRRTWIAGDTDVPGYHRGRVTMLRGDGRPQVFPSDGGWVWWLVVSAV